jgi:hypothetical protein
MDTIRCIFIHLVTKTAASRRRTLEEERLLTPLSSKQTTRKESPDAVHAAAAADLPIARRPKIQFFDSTFFTSQKERIVSNIGSKNILKIVSF